MMRKCNLKFDRSYLGMPTSFQTNSTQTLHGQRISRRMHVPATLEGLSELNFASRTCTEGTKALASSEYGSKTTCSTNRWKHCRSLPVCMTPVMRTCAFTCHVWRTRVRRPWRRFSVLKLLFAAVPQPETTISVKTQTKPISIDPKPNSDNFSNMQPTNFYLLEHARSSTRYRPSPVGTARPGRKVCVSEEQVLE